MPNVRSLSSTQRRKIGLRNSPAASIVKLAWHFDRHTPGNVRINHNPDLPGMVRSLKAARIQEIMTFAKCHFGYAYYPTRVGTPHPRMKGDALGGVIRACHAGGIKVLAYLSFGIDGQAGAKHPEWCQINKEGRSHGGVGFFCICPFTGYLDELMLPQIAEVIDQYQPEGLWFDTMSALAPCYCPTCRRSFRRDTGKEAPIDANDPLQTTFGRWRHDRGVAMIGRVAAFIHQRLPQSRVGFNQIGSLNHPEPAPNGVNILSLDPPNWGPQSVQFSLHAAFGATTGMDCEVLPTIFNQGWDDWSAATELRWEQVAVAVWARGTRLVYGDRFHPEIRLAPMSQHALDFVGKLRRRVEREFPPEDAKSAPDILIVHSETIPYGDDYELFALGSSDRMRRISGAHELCLDSGASFTVAAECYLGSWLDRVRLVVLPELGRITEETSALLRQFVEGGGRLLVVGSTPKVNGKPLDWLGIRSAPKPWQDHIYLPLWPRGDQSPVLVRGDFYKLRLRGANCVLSAILGYDAKYGTRWGIGPACAKPSSYPVLTRRKLGLGEAWFLGAPIFSDYGRQGNWQQIAWFHGLIQQINKRSGTWLESPTGGVELVLWENESSTWAILVQHRCEQLCGTHGSTMPWTRTMLPIPQSNISLVIERRGRVPSRIMCAGKNIPWMQRGDRLEISMRLASIWSVVRVDWKL